MYVWFGPVVLRRLLGPGLACVHVVLPGGGVGCVTGKPVVNRLWVPHRTCTGRDPYLVATRTIHAGPYLSESLVTPRGRAKYILNRYFNNKTGIV